MEPNDPIWKLLGRSPLPESDPWFAARTVARLRREKAHSPMVWLRQLVPLWSSLAAAAIIVIVALSYRGTDSRQNHDTAKIQDALNFLADRGTETDLWLASSKL